ncbi:MAG: hypothetical protein HZB53_11145 [Chloroflexi bacterium]|nr:hypothetical protein [Chloroflexota bacterium]
MFISRRVLFISLLAFAATLIAAIFTATTMPARAAPPGAPQAAALSHFSMSAWAFRPITSSTTYGVSASDCMYATSKSGPAIFLAELPLPEASIIKSVSFRYRNPGLPVSYVTLFANTGGIESSKTQAAAAAGTAIGVATSPEITVTVDLSDTFYFLSWYPNDASESVQLCSVQVNYLKSPVFGAFLPSVMR